MEVLENKQIIDSVILKMSQALDRQLLLFSAVMEERENVPYLEESIYQSVAGLVVKLQARTEDTSVDPTLIRENMVKVYEEERRVVGRYIMSILHPETRHKHQDALEELISTLRSTLRTFNKEFLNVLHLMVLFDGDSDYKYLLNHLANFCSQIIYHEYARQQKQTTTK